MVNKLITFGLDGIWREACARECASGQIVLDLCCGTGELASRISRHLNAETCVIGLDFNKAMLRKAVNKACAARRKRRRTNGHRLSIEARTPHLAFILADAAHLPFKDDCISRIGISFSFRNLLYKNPKLKIYLKEVLRTLRPRGRFVCVETSQPTRHLFRILFRLYCLNVIPLAGWLLSRRRGAYRYLGLSAANFPSAGKITTILLNEGFSSAWFVRRTFGVVALHVAVKNRIRVTSTQNKQPRSVGRKWPA